MGSVYSVSAVHNRPSDFLRSIFRAQLAVSEAAGHEEEGLALHLLSELLLILRLVGGVFIITGP